MIRKVSPDSQISRQNISLSIISEHLFCMVQGQKDAQKRCSEIQIPFPVPDFHDTSARTAHP
jgi:hypothetical protein